MIIFCYLCHLWNVRQHQGITFRFNIHGKLYHDKMSMKYLLLCTSAQPVPPSEEAKQLVDDQGFFLLLLLRCVFLTTTTEEDSKFKSL